MQQASMQRKPDGAAAPATAEPGLSVVGAVRRFGSVVALGGVDIAVRKGELLTLLGPSGSGKTTLLKVIAGFEVPDEGVVYLGGKDVTFLAPAKRDIGMVFQNYALFPHMTVAENVAFPLEMRKVPKDQIKAKVAEALKMVDLAALGERLPKQLSGGQQQRAALARAVVFGPSLLLLDEPFGALDRKLREAMQIDLKRLLRDVGTTAIFVTHDQDEALTMSDRIAVMYAGRIEQLDVPAAIYERPATPFALGFVGLSTRLAGKVAQSADGVVVIDTASGPIRGRANFLPGSPVLVGVRPERIVIGDTKDNRITASLRDVAFQGARVQLHFDAPANDAILAEAPSLPAAAGPGSAMTLSWSVDDTLVYPAPEAAT
jgi:putative spermidine/putrescine transport system ATP-binding protein